MSKKSMKERIQEQIEEAKRFLVYRGRATYNSEGAGRVGSWSMEGDCIILFFPDKWNKEKEET